MEGEEIEYADKIVVDLMILNVGWKEEEVSSCEKAEGTKSFVIKNLRSH